MSRDEERKIMSSTPVALDVLRSGSCTGTPVVLLHPVGLRAEAWTRLAALMQPRPVLVPSLRGHGSSPAAPEPWTVRDLAADVHAVLSHAGRGPANVVGLSLGGMVAQQLAIDHPGDVRSLVLIGTTGGVSPPVDDVLRERGRRALEGGMDAVVDEPIARWFPASARTGPVATRIAQWLRSNDPSCWAATWEAMAGFNVWTQLAGVDVPTLVLAGDADSSMPPEVGRALAAALPDSHLQIVAGAGHVAALEDPERFAKLIGDFLGQHGEAR
ncbi:alpha/beta fold hydrolase [Pseudonocardia adelaidensis]|uniref:3-oxoadipate enol-lactonase n=1 Tax=Pseudonocardia adelaidensis TaxID=648754 RepID=A0ABP9NNU1_9PSEU